MLDEHSKRCSGCGLTKALSDFARHTQKPDGHDSRCKACKAAATRVYNARNPEKVRASALRWYYANREYAMTRRARGRQPRARFSVDWRARGKESAKRAREVVRLFILELKAGRCCGYCGEGDPVCLDWHHRDPATKRFALSVAAKLHVPLDEIRAESEKCIVLCANCHRKWHRRVPPP